MRGRKRKLPENYVPPAYIVSSDDEAQVQRRRQPQEQPQPQHHPQPHHDENRWIEMEDDVFMSESDENEEEHQAQRQVQVPGDEEHEQEEQGPPEEGHQGEEREEDGVHADEDLDDRGILNLVILILKHKK